MSDQDFEEKKIFIERIMDAVVEAGYSDPGYYVDEFYGDPTIFDANGNARQSLAGDSPVAMIKDLAKLLDEDY